MKSSYKVAMIVAALLCAFIVAYYATQDGGEGRSVASQDLADAEGASADVRQGSDDRGVPADRPRRSALNLPDRQTLPSLPSRPAADADAGTASPSQDLMARMARLRNQVNSANADNTASAGATPLATASPAPTTPETSGAARMPSTSSPTVSASPIASDDGDSPPTSAFDNPAPRTLTEGGLRTSPTALGSTSAATPGSTPGSTPGNAPASGLSTTSSTAHRTSSVPAPTPAPARPAAPATYTVRPGDTLSSIARQLYDEERRWVDISRANPTLDPARLRVGQVIRLPDAQATRNSSSTASTAESRTIARSSAPAGAVQYTLQAGDTLSSVARQYYGDPTQWRVIFNANRARLGGDPDRLKVGTVLVIPPAPRGAE